MNRIESPRVRAVLDRLFDDMLVRDAPIVSAWRATGRQLSDVGDHELNEMFGEAYISVARDEGKLLYFLAKLRACENIVEFGSSFGISTIFLAAAAADTGGRVISTEWVTQKRLTAQKNLFDVGLDDFVTILPGNALETLAARPASVDFVFLDGWKQYYAPVLRLLESRMTRAAVIIADNIADDEATGDRDYLEMVRNGADYLSVHLPFWGGVEASLWRP